MANKKTKRGTFVHGIGASQALDSSGERILIDGIDISSLTRDGVFNYEHKNDNASQIVGKILEAKKIFKKADCENKDHEYFWDKVQMPFLYVSGELFDAVGHTSAQDIAAMLKYDEQGYADKEAKNLINFSIEGAVLEKNNHEIVKCVARKITITITPCNKTAIAKLKTSDNDFGFINEIVEKNESMSSVQILKSEESIEKNDALKMPKVGHNYEKIGPTYGEHRPGKPIQPKRTFTSENAPKNLKVGDRITYPKPKPYKPKTGKDIYGKSEGELEKATTRKAKPKKNIKKPTSKNRAKTKQSSKFSYESNMRKAFTAGMAVGTPGVATQGESLEKAFKSKAQRRFMYANPEKIGGQKGIKEWEKDTPKNIPEKVKKTEVLKMLSNQAFEVFPKKEELVKFLEDKLPKLSKNEVLALAKTVAYVMEKRAEIALEKMIKKDISKK